MLAVGEHEVILRQIERLANTEVTVAHADGDQQAWPYARTHGRKCRRNREARCLGFGSWRRRGARREKEAQLAANGELPPSGEWRQCSGREADLPSRPSPARPSPSRS
eukprot:TRINITY_DN56108_c0_g1_i1.p1 TRINITY_DN56108_c0_g1~~TRINITY_DN56108_c0_g1_i1.p1  ORF type:complete len:108 (+),score=4.10 TRINITY_DN56108_c0_g1_i1:176-499(+)